jgi:Uma2 family endonuclease
MQEARQTYLSPDEYLALERQSETKSEYLNGEVFVMSGASLTHAQIVANVVTTLTTRFKGRPCRALGSDTRVKVSQTGLYTYPDVVVICGQLQLDDKQKDTLLNPTLVIEVLSPTTESYDRGAKFAHYQALGSLIDYVVVSQFEARVECFERQPGDKWLLSVYKGLEAVAILPSIGCELPLIEVYDKVEFSADRAFSLRIVREQLSEYAIEEDAHVHPSYPQHHR